MTPAGAQALQHRFAGAGGWIMWLVSLDVAEWPGKAVAWAVVADHGGNTRQPGELIADTLDELRVMLPERLSRAEPLPFLWPNVIETWD